MPKRPYTYKSEESRKSAEEGRKKSGEWFAARLLSDPAYRKERMRKLMEGRRAREEKVKRLLEAEETPPDVMPVDRDIQAG